MWRSLAGVGEKCSKQNSNQSRAVDLRKTGEKGRREKEGEIELEEDRAGESRSEQGACKCQRAKVKIGEQRWDGGSRKPRVVFYAPQEKPSGNDRCAFESGVTSSACKGRKTLADRLCEKQRLRGTLLGNRDYREEDGRRRRCQDSIVASFRSMSRRFNQPGCIFGSSRDVSAQPRLVQQTPVWCPLVAIGNAAKARAFSS